MSANYTDGRAKVGSQKVTFTAPTGGTGGPTAAFVCKNVKFKVYGAKRNTSTDEVGNEDTQWWTGVIPTGTATLQFPTPSTVPPLQFSTFALLTYTGATAGTYIVSDLGETYDVMGETLMDIEFAREMATAAAATDPIVGQ